MIANRCRTLISHTLKNLSNRDVQNPHFSFAFSLFFSTQSQENSKNPSPIFDYLVQNHQFSPETVSKAASALSHLKTPEKCDLILSFLKEIGFTTTHLETFVTSTSCPQVLCANLDQTIKPKIKIFQDLGFSVSDIACIISGNSWLLMHSADNRIFPSLLVLKNVLGSVEHVAKLLKVSAWFFKYDLEKTLVPNIEFMKNCGIDMAQLTQHIYNFPRLFLHRPEILKTYVEKVDEMGFDRESKLYIYAITTVASMSHASWEKKLELFRSLGFTEDDIFQMFQKKPHMFAVSPRKVKEVIQVVLDTGKYDISDVVRHPGVVIASVENRLKPRLQVLQILEDRNLIKKCPGFSSVYLISDIKFITRFVTPYLDELGETKFTKRKLLGEGHSGLIVEA